MGCATSKLDDLPAVALCRDRCSSLDEAISLCNSLSNSHHSYFLTLSSLSLSFCSLFPPLTQPPNPIPPPKTHPPASSRSGSHIDFDDDDSDDSDNLRHHDFGDLGPFYPNKNSLPVPLQQFSNDDFVDPGMGGFFGQSGGFFPVNYMRNKASTPSVVYEQRPISYQTVQFGEASSSSSSSIPPPGGFPLYPYQKSSLPYPDNAVIGGGMIYPPDGYPGYGNSGVRDDGYYANSPPRQGYSAQAKPPPLPPPASAWDFFNPFESYENYYPAYTLSRDSKELREEEGIPDLEDEHEVLKEVRGKVVKRVNGNQKFVDFGKNNDHTRKSTVIDEEDEDDGEDEFHQKAECEGNDDGAEYEVHVVGKKVMDGERRLGPGGGGAARGSGSVAEALAEIEVQFRRASECGNEVAKMLKVGKLPYNRKRPVVKSAHGELKGSAAKAALPPSSMEDANQAQAGVDEQPGMKLGNLSSTLQNLHRWEKKLYSEVKAEERMRVRHDRNVQKLKRLGERGAEAHKVDATRTLIRNLSTKIKMAIQIVDRTSVTINKIRDEVLWPQINELIEGLMRMWRSLLDCHRNQRQAVKESQSLDSILSLQKLGYDPLDATLQFQRELIDWTLTFANWASTQKGFVIALNNWLLKCLLYEPEDTPDGPVPFSPGRIGAPPIFVICHQWSQSMDKISEKEVINSMHTFVMGVLQLWERGKLEMHDRSAGNKDLEKIVNNLNKEDQKIQKQIQALEKKMVHVSGNVEVSETGKLVYQSDINRSNNLHESLQRTFEAMERFSMDSMKVYEELLRRCKEEGLSQGRDRLS